MRKSIMPNYRDTSTIDIIIDNKEYFDEHIRSLSERQVYWLQVYFTKKVGISFLSTRSNNLHEELINQLAKLKDFKKVTYEACMEMSHTLVPDEYFQQIKKSLRVQVFFLKVLIDEHNYNIDKVDTKNTISAIYYYFDRKENNQKLESKKILIDDVVLRYKDIISDENYTKWLSSHEVEGLFWTYKYLNSRNLIVKINNNIDSNEELKDIMLASLDLIDYPSRIEIRDKNYSYKMSANKEIIIDKMKRAWSQQKYRDAGKTKKPYHLPLTKKTKARLEKMAQVQGLSETAMLDILINRFYELDYVDVDGKDLY